MNKRLSDIIERLDGPSTTTIAELAVEFDVSERTVRNDLSQISDLLRERGLDPLVINQGVIEVRPTSLAHELDDVRPATYHLSGEERLRLASILIANSDGYVSLSSVADRLMVSRATLTKDLPGVRALFDKASLEMESRTGRGVCVRGTETHRREFLRHQLLKVGEGVGRGLIAPEMGIAHSTNATLIKIISEQEEVFSATLSDEAFQAVLIHLRLMVSRAQRGWNLEPQPDREHPALPMAREVIRSVLRYCHVQADLEDESRFLAHLLERSRYVGNADRKPDAPKVQLVTRAFIEGVSQDLGWNLNDDYDFFENLSNHLDSVMRPEPVEYPDTQVIRDVIASNSDVHGAVKRCDAVIAHYAGRELTELEIDYITLHVCAAIERKKNQGMFLNVVLACNSGIGTSQLLRERLRQHFSFNVTDVIPARMVTRIDTSSTDLIIATSPIPACSVPSVVVSPLLSDEDVIRVGAQVEALRELHGSHHATSRATSDARELISRIEPVVEAIDPERADALMRAIRRVILERANDVEGGPDPMSPTLHQLLSPGAIRLDVTCDDWREAVRSSADILITRGAVEPRYSDALIANIENNGPYVVISKGLAIPHEGLSSGSLELGMSLVRLDPPIEFGVEEHDPVEFVCCLSAVDNHSHLRALFSLVNLFKEERLVALLHQAATPADISEVIRRFEYASVV